MLNEGQPITKDNLKQRTTSNKGQPQTNDNVKQRATSNKGQHQTKNNLKYKIPSDRIHSHMEDNFALNRRLRQKEEIIKQCSFKWRISSIGKHPQRNRRQP